MATAYEAVLRVRVDGVPTAGAHGHAAPPCPNGHKTFETRRNEPGNA
jgi:hypothetical protein